MFGDYPSISLIEEYVLSLVELNDLSLLRLILGFHDIDKWNAGVKAYMDEYYPDARLRFIVKECCWKVKKCEIIYFVDAEIMINRSDIPLQWSGSELSNKLFKSCQGFSYF
jgi:hypothetical protein